MAHGIYILKDWGCSVYTNMKNVQEYFHGEKWVTETCLYNSILCTCLAERGLYSFCAKIIFKGLKEYWLPPESRNK